MPLPEVAVSFLLRALAGSALAVTMTVLPGAALRAAPLAEEAGREGEPLLELVESEPIETTLENPDIPDAYQVWLDMIAGASTRIDLAHFYASNEPDSRLEAVIAGLEAAADRGVTVRFLAEEKFYATYPQTLDRLAAHAGIEVRRYDVGKLMGGVLHEKMMLVDGREAFVGSQNFDWRSLTHIQELGMRIRVPAVVRFLDDLYETDWRLAGGADPSFRASPPPGGYSFPVAAGGDITAVTPVASPKGWL
jgi:phosphatidylserine/phosphatidylglycerophosphate/cardiolipin synthase-like enzyme